MKGCDLTYQLKLTSNKLLESIQTEKHLLWMSSGSIQSIKSTRPPLDVWSSEISKPSKVGMSFWYFNYSTFLFELQLQKSCKDLRYLSAKRLNGLRISCPGSALNWIDFFNLELVVVVVVARYKWYLFTIQHSFMAVQLENQRECLI